MTLKLYFSKFYKVEIPLSHKTDLFYFNKFKKEQ